MKLGCLAAVLMPVWLVMPRELTETQSVTVIGGQCFANAHDVVDCPTLLGGQEGCPIEFDWYKVTPGAPPDRNPVIQQNEEGIPNPCYHATHNFGDAPEWKTGWNFAGCGGGGGGEPPGGGGGGEPPSND